MNVSLRIFISSVVGIAVFAVLLFVPAGTVNYWQGWAVLAVFSAASLGPALYMARIDPAALERRMQAGVKAETRPVQKAVIAGTFIAFAAILVVPSLDYRFGWSHVPAWLSVLGIVMVSAGLGLTMLVVFQNRYASANITVEEGQPHDGVRFTQRQTRPKAIAQARAHQQHRRAGQRRTDRRQQPRPPRHRTRQHGFADPGLLVTVQAHDHADHVGCRRRRQELRHRGVHAVGALHRKYPCQ